MTESRPKEQQVSTHLSGGRCGALPGYLPRRARNGYDSLWNGWLRWDGLASSDVGGYLGGKLRCTVQSRCKARSQDIITVGSLAAHIHDRVCRSLSENGGWGLRPGDVCGQLAYYYSVENLERAVLQDAARRLAADKYICGWVPGAKRRGQRYAQNGNYLCKQRSRRPSATGSIIEKQAPGLVP